MFLPLRDYNPTLRRPYATFALIGLNVVAWMIELGQGPGLGEFLMRWGAIPARVLESPADPAVLPTLVTSLFLHAGWVHIFFNMLFLWIFGNNVEDFLGSGRYVAFYLACGIAGTILHVVLTPSSQIPTVGASGAVSGLLGAYLLLYPRARVRCVLFLGFFIQIVDVPAVLLISIWIALQVLSGFAGLFTPAGSGGVAYWAHIGGFAAGWLALRTISKSHRRSELWRSRWRQLDGNVDSARKLDVRRYED